MKSNYIDICIYLYHALTKENISYEKLKSKNFQKSHLE